MIQSPKIDNINLLSQTILTISLNNNFEEINNNSESEQATNISCQLAELSVFDKEEIQNNNLSHRSLTTNNEKVIIIPSTSHSLIKKTMTKKSAKQRKIEMKKYIAEKRNNDIIPLSSLDSLNKSKEQLELTHISCPLPQISVFDKEENQNNNLSHRSLTTNNEKVIIIPSTSHSLIKKTTTKKSAKQRKIEMKKYIAEKRTNGSLSLNETIKLKNRIHMPKKRKEDNV
ncbi:hypothetical protein KPH14_002439 [Odynerus spinipes]|uniref:Uncharacterized protein n=1 Tax=Odynerus spinipes TaxID=1348599 RepID=A0AAD9VL57_9HYME|nr:hypothetical protein KPH14_002439 [Odynerus spinipes]